MKAFLKLRSVDQVLDEISRAGTLGTETVALDRACGRIMGRTFSAPEDLPGFDRSTVDGFAVNARDLFGATEASPALLRLVVDCPMGGVPATEVRTGEAARILTGGMMPQGADCVVMLEYARPVGSDHVELTRTQAPGDNVLLHGEDAARGDALIPGGRRLRPQEIGLLAAFGRSEVIVGRRPVTTILSTGDEIVPAEETPGPGEIRDVNAHSVAAACEQAGAVVVRGGLLRDDLPSLREHVADALSRSDIVVLSGGSSAGMRDHTAEAFSSMPGSELLVHGAAISPGKPFILARCGRKHLIGLPGHVGGALICTRVFLLPLIRRLQGASPVAAVPAVTAALTRAVRSAQGRRDFIRVALTPTADGYEATPIPGPSGLISTLVRADGLVVCPENREGLYAGEKVPVEPWTE